jgi:voltage-gated potassium channel
MSAPAPARRAAPATDTESQLGRPPAGWRRQVYTIIFESDTPAGQRFDLAVIAAILLSVAVVIADSVQPLNREHTRVFSAIEWFFTALFTLEYLARVSCVQRPLRYAFSFYGVVDLLAVLPTYIALLVPEAGVLIDVRILRLLRVFRILRLTRYVEEFSFLAAALRASRRKILVFLSFVLMLVLVSGTVLYVVEGPANGFTSIPTAMYWAVTTITTVGFGDIAPKTDLGRAIASLMMLTGWGVLAVPTGIVTAEMALHRRGLLSALAPGISHDISSDAAPDPTRICPACLCEGHVAEANYCRHCGEPLPPAPHPPSGP